MWFLSRTTPWRHEFLFFLYLLHPGNNEKIGREAPGDAEIFFILHSVSVINLFIKEEISFSMMANHKIASIQGGNALTGDHVLSGGHFLGPLEDCEF